MPEGPSRRITRSPRHRQRAHPGHRNPDHPASCKSHQGPASCRPARVLPDDRRRPKGSNSYYLTNCGSTMSYRTRIHTPVRPPAADPLGDPQPRWCRILSSYLGSIDFVMSDVDRWSLAPAAGAKRQSCLRKGTKPQKVQSLEPMSVSQYQTPQGQRGMQQPTGDFVLGQAERDAIEHENTTTKIPRYVASKRFQDSATGPWLVPDSAIAPSADSAPPATWKVATFYSQIFHSRWVYHATTLVCYCINGHETVACRSERVVNLTGQTSTDDRFALLPSAVSATATRG